MPGIFSSIDAYTKRVIHAFYDYHKVLPTWFPDIGKVSGYVDSHALHWSRFLREDEKTRITLRGTPDDVFKLGDNSFHIVDYKTAKATETQDELFPIYDIQLNGYAYISEGTSITPTSGISLIYMEPETDVARESLPDLVSRQSYSLRFKAVHKQVSLAPQQKLRPLLDKIREISEMSTPPDGKKDCRNCGSLLRLLALGQAN
jgi:PD-(D/E)XK nuclease superfamily protein